MILGKTLDTPRSGDKDDNTEIKWDKAKGTEKKKNSPWWMKGQGSWYGWMDEW